MPRIRLALPLVACALACGPGPRPDAAGPAPAPRVVEGALALASPTALAAAGDRVYFADLRGVWTVPVGGGEPRLLADDRRLVGRIVAHGDQLYLGVEGQILRVAAAGGPPTPVYTGAPVTFAVDDAGLWIVDGGAVVHVAAGGGGPRGLAGELGEVAALTTDADAVYVAVAAAEAGAALVVGDDGPPHAIWRIAKQGGARTRLAGGQHGVAGMVVRDGRLLWTGAGAGLRSVAVAGGAVRTELGGRGLALAADRDGVVVLTDRGRLVEVRAGRARIAGAGRAHALERYPAPVLAGGAVVAAAVDLATATDHGSDPSSLWRLARPWAGDAVVLGWVTAELTALRADGGAVLALDAAGDDGGPARILRFAADGQRQEVAAAPGITALAAGAGTVGYATADALWRVDPDRPGAAPARVATLPAGEPVAGLTLAGGAFHWVNGEAVRTVPARGGAVTTRFTPDHGTGGIGGIGRPEAELVLDGSDLYFTSLGWGGDGLRRVRVDGSSDLLHDPAEAYLFPWLARAGRRLCFVVGEEGALWQLPLDGGPARPVPGAPGGVEQLAGAGERVVVGYVDDTTTVIALVDPERRRVTPLFTAGAEPVVVAADAEAAYVALVASDLIVRVPLPPR